MATAFSSSSSSSGTVTPPSNYGVFLSFRGEDTRENFTSHLFAALRGKQIYTFMDEAINKGDKISTDLLNAIIKGSRISLIIFSENYASSKWCLDELVKILECKEEIGQIVIPVFLRVHPSDVSKQTGNFGKAFGETEKRFKNMADKLQKWRYALKEASSLAGYESKKFRNEAELVEVIVKDVLKKLKHTTVSVDSKGLVGINSRIEEVKSLLCIESQDFQIVGIWGMGGIGKTTLADAIFHQISNQFEGKCFMANVREESERHGLKHLRDRFFSEILEEDINIQTPSLPESTKERLRRMKVFIVLDDVTKSRQFEYLAGGLDQLGAGSKIIVTTRNKEVLERCRISYTYNVERLSYHEAQQLFCSYAFRENRCPANLMVHLRSLLGYASGNPLALKVLGSYFSGKTEQDWEKTMHNLKRKSSLEIYDVLKISYDELKQEEKDIFLDIACFFKGFEKDHMTSIFYDSRSINFVMDTLVDKSLITISNNNRVEIHDLLQEMGRGIDREESAKEPRKRSRLWHHEDILPVLYKNKETDSMKGIFLNLSQIDDINLDSEVFANMSNLRLLKFYFPRGYDDLDMRYKVHLPQGLQNLPNELRSLYWDGYPLRMLPKNFNPKNLIELSLPYSKIERLWKGKKKYINLHHSQNVSGIPDQLETSKLERVNLENCENLSCISSSIQKFNNLGHLSLRGCVSLKCFPSNIYFRSPITIDLKDCVNLTAFPEILGKIEILYLDGTNIQEVPSSIENMTDLEILSLTDCKSLEIIATSLCKLKCLDQVDLSDCSKLDSFPKSEKMERVNYLVFARTGIKELPSSIENVKHINCYGCRGLVLPDSLSTFTSLSSLCLGDCGLTEIPQDIGCLVSLKWLFLEENNFKSLPSSIKHLSKLERLSLHHCNMLPSLPSSIKYLSKLKYLSLNHCNMLQSLPELPLALMYLISHNCERLQSLPELPSPAQELDASVLELLSKTWVSPNYIRYGGEFNFIGCVKLNESNILADSQRWIQHLAVVRMRNDCEKVKTRECLYQSCAVNLCFLGSQIPEWFSHQSPGSSITISLPPFCCNRNLIGFAFCAVIASEQPFTVYDPFYCTYDLKTETLSKTKYAHGALNEWSRNIWSRLSDESDQVYLEFVPWLTDSGHHTTISIDFYIDDEDKEEVKVKRVGICPVYAHQSETKPNTFILNMVPPTEEEYKKLYNEFHNEAGTSGSAIPIDIGRFDEEEMNATRQQSSFLFQIFGCWGLDYNCFWRIFQPCFEM